MTFFLVRAVYRMCRYNADKGKTLLRTKKSLVRTGLSKRKISCDCSLLTPFFAWPDVFKFYVNLPFKPILFIVFRFCISLNSWKSCAFEFYLLSGYACPTSSFQKQNYFATLWRLWNRNHRILPGFIKVFNIITQPEANSCFSTITEVKNFEKYKTNNCMLKNVNVIEHKSICKAGLNLWLATLLQTW